MKFKHYTPEHLAWIDAHFDEAQRRHFRKWRALADAFAAAHPQDVTGHKVEPSDIQNKLLQYWVCCCYVGALLECLLL